MALQETPGSPDMGVVQFRIERSAAAMGSDGQLGTVEQIVVDRGSGELRALVVQRSDGQEFELPATHIKRATGDHVYLDVGAADLANNPEIAAPYDPEQYVPVYEGQMAPTGHAARAARDAERPVVTNVEEDAAQVIAPTTSTDAAAATATDADATMTLPRSGTQPAPTAQPSPVESTTGDLVGDKPSTSGMGAASTIPPSPAPPQDTPGSERDAATFGALAQRANADAGEGTDPGMRSAFSVGAERHLAERLEPLPDEYDRSQDAQDLAQAPLTDEPDIAEQETVILSQQLLQPDELGMYTGDEATVELSQPEPSLMGTETASAAPPGDASAALASTPATQPVAPAWQMEGQNSLATPLGLRLAVVGLASGVLAGMIVARRRRQASASQQIQSKASQLASAVAQAAGSAQDALKDSLQDTAKSAQAKTQRVGKQTQKTAKRASRRFRWFRRGLYVGSALALLYTPRSGAETRRRLAAQLDQWRSRTAS